MSSGSSELFKEIDTKRTEALTYEKAVTQFPFLNPLKEVIERSQIFILPDSEVFRNHSLEEDASEAFGHQSLRQRFFVVTADNSLIEPDILRSPRRIYPPEYLHPGMDFPPDEFGDSETVGQVLDRILLQKELPDISHALLYRSHSDGGFLAERRYLNDSILVELTQ